MSRECIFCQGKPVTKEHVFGMWLSPLFKPPPKKRLYVDAEVLTNGVPIKHPRRYPVTIDLQVKQVCQTCNGGWLSQLEAATKPILTAVHNGEVDKLSISDQAILATWAAKTAITIQYLYDDPHVPERRRKWLFHHHAPPPDTFVWLARYDDKTRITAFISKQLDFHDPVSKRLGLRGGQVVTFAIGSLLFLVLTLYTDRNGQVRAEFPSELKEHLFRIWPPCSQSITWPTRGMDDSLRMILSEIDWGNVLRFRFAQGEDI